MVEALRDRPRATGPKSAQTPAQADSSGNVAEFCSRHGLTEDLAQVLLLAQDTFSPRSIATELVRDPDTDEVMVVVNVAVERATAEELLEKYRRYTERFTQAIPWPRRAKIGLSLTVPLEN